MPRVNRPRPPRLPHEGEWVKLGSGEIGVVERVMDNGERLLIRIPSKTDWPFPRLVHAASEKVKRINTPKEYKVEPELPTEEAPF